MNEKFLIVIFFMIVIVLFSCRSSSPYFQERRLGGKCEYKEYRGTGRIIKVEKTKESMEQSGIEGGPGYEGFEVHFKFETTDKVKEDFAVEALKKEHLLVLSNSWYPGEKWIEKYKIKADKKFDGKMKVLIKGTCAPVIFEFDNIKTDDYFESSPSSCEK